MYDQRELHWNEIPHKNHYELIPNNLILSGYKLYYFVMDEFLR